MSEQQSPLRLRKKHGSGKASEATPAGGQSLVQAQSVRNALTAGLITIMVFSIFWVSLADLTNRVFPWLTVVLGFLLGHSIRLAGRGLDWRFPTMAAVMAMAGSLAANIVVAASVTADELQAGTLEVLRAVTSMTWPVFFDEVIGFADVFYAVVAAVVAAFYSTRRLTRKQYRALRLWGEEQQRD